MPTSTIDNSGSRRAGAHPLALWSLLLLLAAAAAGCGAKTGLLVPEEDADVDGCQGEPVPVDRRRAQVMLVIDRSSSMHWTISGEVPLPGQQTRWDLLRDALAEVLPIHQHLLEYGATFYPSESHIENQCLMEISVDLPTGQDNVRAITNVFDRTEPGGGTPTAPALAVAGDYLARHREPGVGQFLILATDGGPNCNPEAGYAGCTCTGTYESYCAEASDREFNCLDEARTLEVIGGVADLGLPLFIIGIEDPNRPDLADYLDQMAIAGGRPRPEPAARRFYSVQREGELRDALDAVTASIARCVFVIDPGYVGEPRLEVSLDGAVQPLDPERSDGWDWTDPAAGELTFFGPACDQASRPEAEVTAELICLEPEAGPDAGPDADQ